MTRELGHAIWLKPFHFTGFNDVCQSSHAAPAVKTLRKRPSTKTWSGYTTKWEAPVALNCACLALKMRTSTLCRPTKGGTQGDAKSRPPPETDHNSLFRGRRGTVLQATPRQQHKPYAREDPWRVKRAHHDLTRSRSPIAKAPLTLTTRTSAPEPSSWPAFGG